MSNKGQKARRVIETALEEQEKEFRQMDEELASFFAEDYEDSDASLFRDWPFGNGRSCYDWPDGQSVDDSDSCLPEIDWGERSLQIFVEELVAGLLDEEFHDSRLS